MCRRRQRPYVAHDYACTTLERRRLRCLCCCPIRLCRHVDAVVAWFSDAADDGIAAGYSLGCRGVRSSHQRLCDSRPRHRTHTRLFACLGYDIPMRPGGIVHCRTALHGRYGIRGHRPGIRGGHRLRRLICTEYRPTPSRIIRNGRQELCTASVFATSVCSATAAHTYNYTVTGHGRSRTSSYRQSAPAPRSFVPKD